MSFDEPETLPPPKAATSHRPLRRPVGPSTSVIITNHNYGHFLGDCIDSVLAQVRSADEVIVVDDGSTDGSRAVLDTFAGRVVVLSYPNGGQAAAFNRGFARSSGDLVVFLDADDRLRPEALEVVLAHWSPELTLLCWGLEIIDSAGRSRGVHPLAMRSDDGDNRPRLLRPGSISGPFAFSPTSGNAWNRRFLERVLPMREAQWRICADAYLVRAAALNGRIRALRQPLGSYRVHGGNNYMRADNFDAWTLKRGLRDLEISAAALEALCEDDRLLAGLEDAAATRIALCLRALETRRHIAVWTRDFRSLAASVAGMVRTIGRTPAPVRHRAAALAGTILYAAAALRTSRHCDPIADAGWRSPRPVPRVVGGASLEAALASLERPRWPGTVRYGETISFAQPGPQQGLLAEGWAGLAADCFGWSTGSRASLEFLTEPADGLLDMTLKLALADGVAARFDVSANGLRHWTGDITQSGIAAFTIDRDPHLPLAPVRLEIACAPILPLRRRLRSSRLRFQIVELTVGKRTHPWDVPLLVPNEALPASLLVRPAPEGARWRTLPDGSAVLDGPEGAMRATMPPSEGRLDLEITTAQHCGTGWLRVSRDGEDLFTGRAGPSQVLRLRGTRGTPDAASSATLWLGFEPQERGGERLALASVRLVEVAPADAGAAARHLRHDRSTPLHAGQTVFFASNPGAASYLRDGWAGVGPGGAVSTATEASLSLGLPDSMEEPVLRLVLRPSLTLAPDRRHVVGLSIAGELLASAELHGEGEMSLRLPCDRPEVDLTIHSVLITPASASEEPRPACLELVSLRLEGRHQPVPATPSPPPEPALAALLGAAARALDDAAVPLDAMLSLRTDLARMAWRAYRAAIAGLVSSEADLMTIERLGLACEGASLDPESAAIAAEAEALGTASLEPDDRLRALVVGMLLLPAYRSGLNPDLATLPQAVLRAPGPLVAYLGREPHIENEADHAAYLRYAEALIENVDRVLTQERPGSALHALAEAILAGFRSTSSLFGGCNLVSFIAKRAAAVERLLIQSGARLGAARTPRPHAGRLRVGALVRSLRPGPETWAVLGMYRGIDRSRVQPLLLTLDQGPEDLEPDAVFDEWHRVEPVPVQAAVDAIRALDLDLLVLGAHTTNWEPLASIVAHRLARVQLLSCFNSPSTLGYRSFDYAIGWNGTADAQDQYVEELVEMAEPLQCCFDFRDVRPAVPEREAVRRELGLAPDAVLMTSGAMVKKIGAGLLDAWCDILAGAPQARLVLYPFASVWSLRLSPEVFRRRVAAALASRGLPPDRILALPEQSNDEVRRLLAASDLYLDSYPYSGGTTVCEALASGTPVVALEGRMLRERTAAPWLREYGIGALVARSPAEYVSLALRAACESDFRTTMRARVEDVARRDPQPCSDFPRIGAALTDSLWESARRSGLFPDLGHHEPPVEPASAAWRTRRASSAIHGTAPVPTIRNAPAPAPTIRRALAPARFVVLATARTGSTLLCEIAGRAPDSLVDQELFHEDEIQLRGGVIRDAQALARRNADPVDWLRRHHEAAEEAGYRLTGFKLLAHHSEPILRHVCAGAYRLILLTRENVLGQYASFRIAERTRQWVLRGDEPRRAVPLDFDPEDFERFEATMLRLRARLEAAIAAAPAPALRLEYAGLQEPRTIERLSDFLDCELPASGRNEPIKQNPGPVLARFADPEPVRAYIARRDVPHWAEAG